jgi:hypothetical protein
VGRIAETSVDTDGDCPELRPAWGPNVDAMGEIRQSMEGEGVDQGKVRTG